MSLDRTSESIAHFSGLFEKTLEEARLRQEYTEFKAIQKKEAEDAEYEFAAPNIKRNSTSVTMIPMSDTCPKRRHLMRVQHKRHRRHQPQTPLT